MKDMIEMKPMCFECGRKYYTKVNDTGAITVRPGICTECGLNTYIVPVDDWAYYSGASDLL